jgi:hypothetical protein
MLINIRTAICLALLSLLTAMPTAALSIRDYRKLNRDQQTTFVLAAVSMLAYNYAANGEVPRATCVKNWFFGQHGEETQGPKELAVQIGIAEQRDPDHYLVEGVILGTLEKACPAPAKAKQ